MVPEMLGYWRETSWRETLQYGENRTSGHGSERSKGESANDEI
jgi:hypothetical protein